MRPLRTRTFALILALVSFPSIATGYSLRVFGDVLSVPVEYVVNPNKFGKHVMVRLQKSLSTGSFSEITVFDISVCDSDCEELVLSIEALEYKDKFSMNGIHAIEFVGKPETGLTSVVYLYNESQLVKVSNNRGLAFEWIESMNQ